LRAAAEVKKFVIGSGSITLGPIAAPPGPSPVARSRTVPSKLTKIHHDSRISPVGKDSVRIEGSNGRFLIAVEALFNITSSTLLVPLARDGMRGTVIEIPGCHPQLARDVAGFATMDDPLNSIASAVLNASRVPAPAHGHDALQRDAAESS
jgi:hypothetical protein